MIGTVQNLCGKVLLNGKYVIMLYHIITKIYSVGNAGDGQRQEEIWRQLNN